MKFLNSEFFKNNLGQKSMSRLLPFMAFPFSTILLLYLHSDTALGYYLSAYVVNYGISKVADAYQSNKE